MSDSTYWTITHSIGVVAYIVLLATNAASAANGSGAAFQSSFDNLSSGDADDGFSLFQQNASKAQVPYGAIAVGSIGMIFNLAILGIFLRIQRTGSRQVTAARTLHRQKIVLIVAVLGNVAFVAADIGFAAALAAAKVRQFAPGIAGAAIAAVAGLAVVVVDIIGLVDLQKERRQVHDQRNIPLKEPERIPQEGAAEPLTAGDWTLHTQRPPPYDPYA